MTKKPIIIAILLIFLLCVMATGLTMWYTEAPPPAAEPISQITTAPTYTPQPTFTPQTETATPIPLPTETPRPRNTSTPSPTPTATATPTMAVPQLSAGQTVNLRSGPGVAYPVVGALRPQDGPQRIVGRNQAGDWWQISGPTETSAWVAAAVVTVQNQAEVDAQTVPLATAPPLPTLPPTPTPTPTPMPTRPLHQFEATGWYGDTNYGLTRFLGSITDAEGNPVDGVFVEAQCGTYKVISNPSGPVPWKGESQDWPPGFYDLTIDTRPVPCKWLLTIVTTEDRQTATSRLSEPVEVEVTVEQSIIVANWRKNW